MEMQTSSKLPSAVIWDMDGTLIDQTSAILRCYAKVIVELGFEQPDPGAICRSLGGPMASTMALFVGEDQMDAACKAFRANFPSMMFDGLIVLPGALDLIQKFHQAEIPQIILTNKHGETARKVSQHCGFDQWIENCIGNTDTEWSKPSVELTLHTLDTIASSSKGAICIGDSPTDVATAQNADMQCYGVTTGAHSQTELLEAGAVAVFDSLVDLQGYLFN